MAPVLDPPQTVEWNGQKVPVWGMQTINYGLLLSQNPSEIDKVVNACLEDGYFYLDLQGIDGRRMLADQKETLKLMKRFFDAPIEQKNEFGLISSHLGYVVVSPSRGHPIPFYPMRSHPIPPLWRLAVSRLSTKPKSPILLDRQASGRGTMI